MTPTQLKALPYNVAKSLLPSLSGITREEFVALDDATIQLLIDSNKPAGTAQEATEAPATVYKRNTSKAIIKEFLELNEITIGVRVASKGNRIMPYDDIQADLLEWCQLEEIKVGLRRSTDLEIAYSSLFREAYTLYTEERWNALNGTLSNSVFDQFKIDFQLTDQDAILLKWWMANIKNKLHALATGEYLNLNDQVPAPIFFGGQGLGKTYIIRELCKPLKELSAQKKVSDIMDNFGQLEFGKILIADFDDISTVDHKNLAALKQWMTQEWMTPRKMRSEKTHTIRKISSIIGSSNQPISVVIPDTSGTRRFYQIDVPSTGYVDAIKSTDFEKLWSEIDKDYRPTTKEQQDIIAIQYGEQRNKHHVELFLEDTEQHGAIPARELYVAYTEWTGENGNKPLSSQALGRKLTSLGIKKMRKKSGNVYTFQAKVIDKEIKTEELEVSKLSQEFTV